MPDPLLPPGEGRGMRGIRRVSDQRIIGQTNRCLFWGIDLDGYSRITYKPLNYSTVRHCAAFSRLEARSVPRERRNCRVSVGLSEHEKHALEEIAERSDLSLSRIVQEAVREFAEMELTRRSMCSGLRGGWHRHE